MSESTNFSPGAVFAYDVLVSYAARGEKITYGDLYNIMAPKFRWPPLRPGHSWFKRLPLAEVGSINGGRGEPCLSALVRQKDGAIGKGYQTAHFNCYGKRLTTHEYECECGNCRYLIKEAARKEALAVFDHWGA